MDPTDPMLVYRTNVPEKPRPPKAPFKREWRAQDGLDWRPRTLYFKRRRPPISLSKAQSPVESPKTQSDVGCPPQEIQMAAKKAKTKKSTAAKPATKGPGVITTIIDCISKDRGATADEMVAVLVKAFPDREADGMRKTVLIQANKNCTSKETDEKRGLIYFRRGRK
jgi:hypothetical protein